MAQFCSHCGTRYANESAKYCYNCGKQSVGGIHPSSSSITSLSASNSDSASTSSASTSGSRVLGSVSTPKSTLSYEEFRKRKELSRAKKIQSSSKKAKKSNENVKIQIGIVEADDGKLKRLKGRTLPLFVSSSCTADELLKAATDKHSKRFKQFDNFEEYALLYFDYSVVLNLPGSSKEFVLSEYKTELGKAYSKIYFYLCKKSDLTKVADFAETESDDDVLMRGVEKTTRKSIKTEDLDLVNVSDNDDDHEQVSYHVQETACPTCFKLFTPDKIQLHANICADKHFDSIGEVSDDDLEEILTDSPDVSATIETERTVKSQDDQRQILKDVVTKLANEYVEPVKIRINVRRKSVFKDYLEIRKKVWFNSRRLLKVTFIGEPAIDDGGPRREFFQVLQSIQDDLFENGMPVPDMAALGSGIFTTAGELMAGSIVQGGPAPCFLCSEAYAYIVGGISSIATEMWAPHVSDKKLADAIDKIGQCKTDESFQNLLVEDNMMDVLQQIHYRGVPSRETMQSVENILRPIIMFDFAKYLPMMEQLVKGLSSFGMMDAIKDNKSAMEALFVQTHAATFFPTADKLLDDVVAMFSEDGSNLKDKEVNVYKFFSDMLQDAGSDPGSSESNGKNKMLCALHKFITGSEYVPPLGLPKNITVKFKHGCSETCKCRPTASTCDLSITLPVHYHSNYDNFKEIMDSALVEAKGFGLI